MRLLQFKTPRVVMLMLAVVGYFSLSKAQAEGFVAPYTGYLYMQCLSGSASATSQFGTGTSPADFVAYLSGLPSSCPSVEVLVGAVNVGQTVQFGISTFWNGQNYWAFSGGTDQPSVVAFTDVCYVLGWSRENNSADRV
jgi:hypothetical protein